MRVHPPFEIFFSWGRRPDPITGPVICLPIFCISHFLASVLVYSITTTVQLSPHMSCFFGVLHLTLPVRPKKKAGHRASIEHLLTPLVALYTPSAIFCAGKTKKKSRDLRPQTHHTVPGIPRRCCRGIANTFLILIPFFYFILSPVIHEVVSDRYAVNLYTSHQEQTRAGSACSSRVTLREGNGRGLTRS